VQNHTIGQKDRSKLSRKRKNHLETAGIKTAQSIIDEVKKAKPIINNGNHGVRPINQIRIKRGSVHKNQILANKVAYGTSSNL
jgi:hypothetical protein